MNYVMIDIGDVMSKIIDSTYELIDAMDNSDLIYELSLVKKKIEKKEKLLSMIKEYQQEVRKDKLIYLKKELLKDKDYARYLKLYDELSLIVLRIDKQYKKYTNIKGDCFRKVNRKKVFINYDIDGVFNVFSNDEIDNIISRYQLDNYYCLEQIHSNNIHIVDDNYINRSKGDVLITDKVNTPIVIRTADCIPILIYDNKKRVLGVVHSGWMGTLNNVIMDSILVFINRYNSKKEDIYVYMYPSILKCHFEVDDDVYLKFKDKYSFIDDYCLVKDQKYYIDLSGIICHILKSFGINHIKKSTICTYCNCDTLYSYRYNKTDKRNYLLAYIEE